MLQSDCIVKYPQSFGRVFDNPSKTLLGFESGMKAELSALYAKLYTDAQDRFLYDVWTVLAEVFFKCFNTNPRYGIHDYHVVESEDCLGLDAVGLNTKNVVCLVKTAFTSHVSSSFGLITYQDLATAAYSGLDRYSWDVSESKNLVVFTNAKSIDYQAKQNMQKHLVVIDRQVLQKMIDGNSLFWETGQREVRYAMRTRRKTK